MTKKEVAKMFEIFFNGQDSIYTYFKVKEFDTWNYELQMNPENWKVVGNPPRTLHHLIPEGEEDGTYQGEIEGIFRKKWHTLVFVRSCTGDSGFAYILDNDQEIKE